MPLSSVLALSGAGVWIGEGTTQRKDNSRIAIAVLSGDGVLSRVCQQDDHGVGIACRARLRTVGIAINSHRPSCGVSRWTTTIARRPDAPLGYFVG